MACRRQMVIWTNAGLLLMGLLGIYFGKSWKKEQHLANEKMSSAKRRLHSFIGHNMLKNDKKLLPVSVVNNNIALMDDMHSIPFSHKRKPIRWLCFVTRTASEHVMQYTNISAAPDHIRLGNKTRIMYLSYEPRRNCISRMTISIVHLSTLRYDDMMAWKPFPNYWPIVWGIL